jgi:hypothetical protein
VSGGTADEERCDLLEHRLARIERLLAIGFTEQIRARRAAAVSLIRLLLRFSSGLASGALLARSRRRSKRPAGRAPGLLSADSKSWSSWAPWRSAVRPPQPSTEARAFWGSSGQN